MRELKVGKNDAGQRIDKFLTKALGVPAGLLYKSIRTKKIKRNRKRCEGGDILVEGDTIQCFLPEEFFGREVGAPSLLRIDAKPDILYEDDNILLINKRPGIPVHEDEDGKTNNLITQIQSYLYRKGEYDPETEQSFAPALCNRIDRNTGGIVIAAKNAAALRVMNEKIKNREIDKFYLAAVHGTPVPPEALLTGYLIKDEERNTVRIYDRNPPRGAKKILTKYRTLAPAKDGKSTLLEVHLLTGRTHQIRAHMAHVGHPLIGDGKYGVNKADRAKGYKFQALCSYKLVFRFDPKEQTPLDYLDGRCFEIPKREIYFVGDYLF